MSEADRKMVMLQSYIRLRGEALRASVEELKQERSTSVVKYELGDIQGRLSELEIISGYVGEGGK